MAFGPDGMLYILKCHHAGKDHKGTLSKLTPEAFSSAARKRTAVITHYLGIDRATIGTAVMAGTCPVVCGAALVAYLVADFWSSRLVGWLGIFAGRLYLHLTPEPVNSVETGGLCVGRIPGCGYR